MKRTKKQAKAYHATALGILRGAGAQLSDTHHPYQLETTAGTLRVSVYGSYVCTRFDDVARAKALLPTGRLNPFSGKWNWMGGMTHEGDLIDLAQFQQELRHLLPEDHQPNPDLPLVPYED